jgi:hypothetical protein
MPCSIPVAATCCMARKSRSVRGISAKGSRLPLWSRISPCMVRTSSCLVVRLKNTQKAAAAPAPCPIVICTAGLVTAPFTKCVTERAFSKHQQVLLVFSHHSPQRHTKRREGRVIDMRHTGHAVMLPGQCIGHANTGAVQLALAIVGRINIIKHHAHHACGAAVLADVGRGTAGGRRF